jgi:hypothetical protein
MMVVLLLRNVLLLLLRDVHNMVEPLDHVCGVVRETSQRQCWELTRIVCRLDATLLDVGQELVNGIVRAAALGTGHRRRGPVHVRHVRERKVNRVELGRGRGEERALPERRLGRLPADTLDVVRVVDGDRLGVLVLGMVLLGVDLLMLLEVLGALEALRADFADVRLQGRVY